MKRPLLLSAVLLVSIGAHANAQSSALPPPPAARSADAEPPTPAPAPAAPQGAPLPPAPGPAPGADATGLSERAGQTFERLQTTVERVPDNPAVDLIGAEDLQITKPGSVKELGAELRGLYKDGKIVPQVAIEFSPFALTLGRSSGFEAYRTTSYIRFLRRITASLATTSVGVGNDETIMGAIGLRFRIVDGTDWRLNDAAIQCAFEALATPPPAGGRMPSGTIVPGPEPSDEAKKKVSKCFTDHVRWNATQWAVGMAVSSAFPQGEVQADIHDLATWTSATFGLGDHAQLVLGGKYLFSDTRLEDGVRVPARHTAAATGRLELRKKQYGLIFTAGSGARWSNDMTGWRREAIGLFGAEAQLAIGGDKWISLRFSGEVSGGEKDRLVSIANLKWNYDISGGK
ncbi:MAG TPA: hypothetical protein VN253_05700 [Kofleriaceae bacterium]|nr:hypothetical protein [Kofleriaceae bacterium]